MKWQKELPNEEGDWLWVEMWGCGCCVIRSGIAWVFKHEPEGEFKPAHHYKVGDTELAISWEHQTPPTYGAPDVTAWMKVELPFELATDQRRALTVPKKAGGQHHAEP